MRMLSVTVDGEMKFACWTDQTLMDLNRLHMERQELLRDKEKRHDHA